MRLALDEGASGSLRCLTMPDYRAQYGAAAWALTRESIGAELRSRYELSIELSPRLVALIRQLSPMEYGALPKVPIPSLALLQKLDAFEGDQLLRICGERLRELPRISRSKPE
jgi:hypothetical protein